MLTSDKYEMIPKTFLLLPLMVLMPACAPLVRDYEAERHTKRIKESEGFYISHTEQTFPPKGKKFEVPVLSGKPQSKHVVIGSMHYSSTYSMGEIREELMHNARKNGADAIVLAPVKSKSFQQAYSVPPMVLNHPTSSFSNLSMNSYASGSYAHGSGNINTFSSTPILHPGFNGVRTVTENEIHAFMIRMVDQTAL